MPLEKDGAYERCRDGIGTAFKQEDHGGYTSAEYMRIIERGLG